VFIYRVLWSRPIPLAWYMSYHWKKKYGRNWSGEMCEKWIVRDRLLKNYAADVIKNCHVLFNVIIS